MNKFLSAALFVNVFLSPFLVVASDKDATAVYVSSSDVIDRGLGTTSFLSDNSAKSATTRMLHSLKGTKDFTPLDDKKQTSQKMTNFQSNNRQEPHVERNMSTQAFPSKSELQTAVNEYCNNPSEWVNRPNYAKYGPITDWDVSLITDMSNLFEGKSTCDPDIGSWDVSAVTTFKRMFYEALAFNQDIGSWDVSKGVDFSRMFRSAIVFNQDIGSWDVSKGVNFSDMFRIASVFNQDIGSWDVSNGVNFYAMFEYANAFNQDIGSWDVSKGVTFSGMFFGASVFNQDIGSWDVSNGDNFNGMFYGNSFNQDIGSWDVSKGVTFQGMFGDTLAFNQDIGSWDVSNGVNFHKMFRSARAFNQDIGSWDVSNGVNFETMFYHADAFRQNLSCWEKSPTSNTNNFCGTGSYCGDGVCISTSEPSSAPSKIYSDVPSSIPTVSPSSVPSKIALGSAHFIGLVKNSTDINFSEDRASDEIKFGLNVTHHDISEGNLDSSINVFAGLHCNGTALESDILNVTADIPRNKDLNADGAYTVIPVIIDVNTTNITAVSASIPGYFTAEDDKVTLKFCVMPELGAVDILVDGVSKTSSISYTKINFVVEIDMQKGFQSASATVTEDAPEENNQNTQIDYNVTACECYDTTKACIEEADIQPKTQNSAINICIYTDSNNDVVVESIKDMKIEDTSNSLAYAPITANAANAISTVSGEETKRVMVTTRLIGAFFSGLEGGSATLDITGTAVLKFESGIRRLVNIRGGAKNEETNSDLLADVRKLQAGAGEAKFGASLVILNSSTSGGSSMMKAVAMMLGVTGVVFV